MGDWRYIGLSMIISFVGPFYFLEEKIYQFNEAERIARETCISFNQEMKPFWKPLQERIFKPGISNLDPAYMERVFSLKANDFYTCPELRP